MTTFVLDLWQDLRTKRLWPVALLLLVAIAATPVVLLGLGSEEPAPATPADVATDPGAPAPGLGNLVAPSALPVGGSSRLDQFKARDPFAPEESGGGGGEGLPGAGGTGGAADAPTDLPDFTAPSTGGGGRATPTPSPGGAASAPSPEPPSTTGVAAGSSSASAPATPVSSPPSSTPSSKGGAPSGGGSPSGGGGSNGGSGGGTNGGGGSNGSGGGRAETRYFTYEADIKFGKPGNVRTRQGVSEFTPLPDAERGVVLFNGVTIRDQLAVFSVFYPEEAPRVNEDIRAESCIITTPDETDPTVERCLVFVLEARGERVRVGDYVLQVADIKRVRLS